LNELFTSKYGNQFYKIKVTSSWIGKSATDLFMWLKNQYNAVLLSVEKGDEGGSAHPVVNPDSRYIFGNGDHIIVISHEKICLK